MGKTYDPTVVAVILGASAMTSWNEVEVAMNEEGWFFNSGTTGEDTRSKNANKLGTIMLRMPQSSDDNDVLSAAYAIGSTINITIKDNNSRDLYIMPAGTIKKMPDVTYGKESGEVEWPIEGKWGLYFKGGNI